MQIARQDVVVGRAKGRDLRHEVGHDFATSLSLRSVARAVPSRAAAHADEAMLLDALDRAHRRGDSSEALLLRLSQLRAPGAKPHHRRIARALLDEAALRHGGQVFALRNLDLVLLGPAARATRDLLVKLFGEGDGVVQVRVPGPALLAYTRDRADEDVPLADLAAELAPPIALDSAEALLESTASGDLLQAQVAAELLPGGALRPLFREVTPRLPALAARLPRAGGHAADRFPAHDLAARLDARTLAIACTDLAESGPLSAGSLRRGGRSVALHLNLTLASVLSPRFARFARIVVALGGAAGVELSLVEACADPAAFGRARDLVRAAGFTLALDGVGHRMLAVTHPGRLRTDLVKLEWSDELAATEPDAAAALYEIGPARVVLTGADGEAAMRWGYGRGIRRFQGRHVDTMLAASRLGACAFASGCTLRRCCERASATGAAGRAGCQNTALLDAAA